MVTIHDIMLDPTDPTNRFQRQKYQSTLYHHDAHVGFSQKSSKWKHR